MIFAVVNLKRKAQVVGPEVTAQVISNYSFQDFGKETERWGNSLIHHQEREMAV